MPELNSTGTPPRAWQSGDRIVVVKEGGASPDEMGAVNSNVPASILAPGTYATPAQGALADSALQPGDTIPWTDVTGKPTFAAVATTGAYSSLTGIPSTFPPSAHAHVIADTTGLQAALDGKQAAGSYAAASHGHAIADTTGLQAALDGKAAASHTHPVASLSDSTAAGRSMLTAADAATQRTLLSMATIATSGSASDLASGTLPAARFDDTAHGARAGGTLHSAATTSVAGFLSAADKTKLDGVAAGANNYSHPNHSGDVTSSGDGATTIANDAVTYAKMQNVSGASLLLGRGAGGGAGDVQEITLGTNLSMTGATLNATGGGGGVLNNLTAAAAPTVSNDSAGGYAVGSRWLWAARGLEWVCVDATAGAAVWQEAASVYPRGIHRPRVQSWFSDLLSSGWSNQSRFGDRWGLSGGAAASAVSLSNGARALRVSPTGTTTSGTLSSQSTNAPPVGGQEQAFKMRCEPRAASLAVPDATQDWQFVAGISNDLSSPLPAACAQFVLAQSGGSAYFEARTRPSWNATLQSTALPMPAANEILTLEVVCSSSNTRYFVNDSLVATHGARTGEVLSDGWHHRSNAGANPKTTTVYWVAARSVYSGDV